MNERYHTPEQALAPEPLIRLPFRGKPQGIKPCFPRAHSGMNKFTPLISLRNEKEGRKTIVIPLLCILLLQIFPGCTSSSISIIKTLNKYEWNIIKNEKGIAITIHGLNTKPEKMSSVSKVLNDCNYSTLNITLSGHDGNIQDMQNVTDEIWLSDFHKGYYAAKQRADKKKIPIIFTGFSLGALVGLNYQTKFKQPIFDSMILFAPAITTNTYTKLVKIFYIFGKTFLVPSMQPKEYRVSKGTSVAAYKALFSLIEKLDESNYLNMNIPALVFIDTNDELINTSRLEEIISQYTDQNSKFVSINKSKNSSLIKYHHLIIDESSTGPDYWNLIKNKITDFLK